MWNVDPDLLYPNPDPQNLMNPNPVPDQLSYLIDFNVKKNKV